MYAITYCELVIINKEQITIENNFTNFEINKQHYFE
jgi:hypothetical protein